MVRCHCQQCNDAAVMFSEFEAHAGAEAGRPGDAIVLSDCGATLRVRSGHFVKALLLEAEVVPVRAKA